MSPPGPTATAQPGVSASPTMDELKAFARLIVTNIGASIGTNAINRLVLRFTRRMPNGNGWAFFLFVANAIQMSEGQRRHALADPDIARAISYADPVGELAVNNVLREQRRGRVHAR